MTQLMQGTVPSEADMKAHARATARKVLSLSSSFQLLPVADQKEVYLSVVKEEMDKQRAKHGLARSMATDSGKDMGYDGYKPSFGEDTKDFQDLVSSVNFSKFTGDLLKAVFDANLSVMKQQTDAYIKLMKECTKSSADFLKKVKDDDCFAQLAESKGDKYNVTTEKGADGQQKLSLVTPEGEKHDLEDAEVKKDLLETKLNMAKEHRAALREVLLMGVTRLVVEKGEIETGVDFEIHASRNSNSQHSDQSITTTALDASYGGGLAGIFGGPSGSFSVNNTSIKVNTASKQASDDLTAKLHGKVNIKFKTDYFKLDNFANMYADGGVAALKPPAAAAGALPAPSK